MSLCVINNQSEELCNTAVVRFVQDSLEQQGRCVVVVPRHKLARQLLRELAQHKNCSVGVQVETPLSYARSLWELWGDGRRLISADVRIVLMSRCLAASQEQGLSVATDKGTARFLARLAQHHLPWLGITDQGELDGTLMASAGLSACETEAFRVIASYKSEIKARGFIEESELMAEVAKLSSSASLVLPPRVLATGFTSLPRAQRSFFEGLAEASQLHIMTRSESGPAFERMQQDLTLLTAAVAESKIDIEELHVAADICERAPELEQLLSSIFYQGRTCESTGAVRLLIASGPLAEAELIARKIDQLPAADIKQIVLATPDPIRMWHELGPKLYQSHISVSADLSQAFFDTEAGRALYEYLTVIVQLALLDETWPSPLESTEGALIQLGDMQWWPPQQLTDFLLSPLSGVSSETAYRLDKEWRANRLLTPRAVLNTLMSSRHGSPALEQATRELLKNRPTSAGSRLLRQFLERVREQYETDSSHNADTAQSESSIYVGEMTIAQVEAVLSALMKINTKLKEPDFTYDGLTQAQKLNLSVQELTLALEQSRISMRPQLIVDDAEQELRIMSYADAAQLNPASQDCLIVSGATSGEDPIGVGDELTQSLLCRLGAEREDNRLAAAREQFLALLAVPSKLIICERTLFTADSKPAYPSVMLTELLGCYNVDAQNYDELKGFVDLQLGEQDTVSLISPQRLAPQPCGSEDLDLKNGLPQDIRNLVVVPPEGVVEFSEAKPLLSASQIESYLECPCKWFSLRRLRLSDNDAGFSPLEMGTFAHRVLELTHTRLFEEALSSAGCSWEEFEKDPTQTLNGSALIYSDKDSMRHAHDVLDDAFIEHLRHQRLLSGKKPAYQALVPHSNYDDYRIRELHSDLSGLLDYEAQLFSGFEPRFFEWSFGRSGEQVEYAHVHLTGTVDRIDVDPQGNAIIIDYKHKPASSFFDEYAWRPKDASVYGLDQLPRRVQSLVYAQVVRRAFPQLKLVGAVYLASKAPYEISGVVQSDYLARVAPQKLDSSQGFRLTVSLNEDFGVEGAAGMEALLDRVEAEIAVKLDGLQLGEVAPQPRDARACEYCPVLNCPERRTS